MNSENQGQESSIFDFDRRLRFSNAFPKIQASLSRARQFVWHPSLSVWTVKSKESSHPLSITLATSPPLTVPVKLVMAVSSLCLRCLVCGWCEANQWEHRDECARKRGKCPARAEKQPNGGKKQHLLRKVAHEIPPLENYRLATAIGSELFGASLAVGLTLMAINLLRPAAR